MLSLVFIENNTSAISYSNNVNVGFTFNPSLSLSISSSDLVIDNLTPGTTADSNNITISVVTNASYGYTLSATTSNNNLVRSDDVDSVFSSIANNANLSSLDEDENNNIWGYSTSLDNGSTWSNYNGLSSSSSTTLLNKDNNTSSNVNFRIGAKSSSTQPSGIYTDTITFYATTKPTPITLAEAYASENKTMINGFYAMQDMNSTICEKTEAIGAQLQVLDIRDYKLYWISKLADNHCWMTQNLDLDLDSTRTYTHWDTDLGWSTENGNTIDENASWKPSHSTINFNGATTNQVTGWVNSNTEPYSANPGDIYYYTSNSDADDIQYNSLQECIVAGHSDCTHYHAGNYYNWSAAVGINDTNTLNVQYDNAPSSICPTGWKLPKNQKNSNDFGMLLLSSNITNNNIGTGKNIFLENGFKTIRTSPVFLIRAGSISHSILSNAKDTGFYWVGTVSNDSTPRNSYNLHFLNNYIDPASNYNHGSSRRYCYFSIRCLAR